MIHRWKSGQFLALAILALLAGGPCSPAWANDGDLDLGFGANGIISTPIDSRALAIQADGRIIVVGAINGDFGMVRYNADGSLDVTFGQGGVVQTDLGGNDSADRVVLSADGRILVGGTTGLARYTADGSLDAGFGTGGLVTDVPGGDMVIRSDGMILIRRSLTVTHLNGQGGVEFASTLTLTPPCALPIAPCPSSLAGQILAVALLPSGQIVAAGVIANQYSGLPGTFFVARYNEDGTPDTSFGTGGVTATRVSDDYAGVNQVAVQEDGTILVVGAADFPFHYPPFGFYSTFVVVRYKSDGRVGGGFSGRDLPVVCTPGTVCRPPPFARVLNVASDRDGTTVAVLSVQGSPSDNIVLARGAETIATLTDVLGQGRTPSDIEIQPDGKILVAGAGILARFLGLASEDLDSPVIECDQPDGIWHAGNVTLTCMATDAGSGLANPEDDTHFTLTTSVAAGDEWPNAFTDSRQICDKSGNCASAGPIGGNMIDRRPPTVAVIVPAAGSTFTLGQHIDADYVCHDAGSGVQSCIGAVPGGTPVNTSSVGLHTFDVTGLDVVGNSAHASSAYTVSYGICLRYDPSRPKNGGSTLPIKLQLCNASGGNVSSPAVVVRVLRVFLLSSSAQSDLAQSGPAHAPLEFRFSEGQYILNQSLKGFAAGTYGLQLKAGNDPTIHTLQFEVRSSKGHNGGHRASVE